MGRPKMINTLVIGDLHSPFILEGYLEFCKAMYKRHNCKRVVFIGDIIDNHYSSFHDSDPDGEGAGRELERTIEQLKPWMEAFPVASICIGNHDAIPHRKAFASGLSNRWVKNIGDVIDAPSTWTFAEAFDFGDGVIYTHGTGRKAISRAKQDICSIVQGHYHSESYVINLVGMHTRIFAMQVGCGIDRKAYAFAYGKQFAKPHISCGIVKRNGESALVEMMNIDKPEIYIKKKKND